MPVVSVTELSVLAGIYSVHFLYEPCYNKHRTCWVQLPGRWAGMFPRFRLSPELWNYRLYSWGLICRLASQLKFSYPANRAKKKRGLGGGYRGEVPNWKRGFEWGRPLQTHLVFSPFFSPDCHIIELLILIWGFASGKVTCCSSGRAFACWRSAGLPGGPWPPCAGGWGNWQERPSSQCWPSCPLTSLWRLGGTQVSGGTVGHPPAHSPRATEHHWGRGAERRRGLPRTNQLGGNRKRRRGREEELEVEEREGWIL